MNRELRTVLPFPFTPSSDLLCKEHMALTTPEEIHRQQHTRRLAFRAASISAWCRTRSTQARVLQVRQDGLALHSTLLCLSNGCSFC